MAGEFSDLVRIVLIIYLIGFLIGGFCAFVFWKFNPNMNFHLKMLLSTIIFISSPFILIKIITTINIKASSQPPTP